MMLVEFASAVTVFDNVSASAFVTRASRLDQQVELTSRFD